MAGCIKCGDSGFCYELDEDGQMSKVPCDCGAHQHIELPVCISIPVQYQGIKFSKALLREELSKDYGIFMEELLNEYEKGSKQYHKNYIICAPPNSGKTVWAYTLYSILYGQGRTIPEIMDLMEARNMLLNYYYEDKKALELLSTAPVAIIKLPWDLPNRFVETMSSIIDRRVRTNSSTIFLYNGDKAELFARDTFGKLQSLIGDGCFNSVCIKSW